MVIKIHTNLNLVWNLRFSKSIFFYFQTKLELVWKRTLNEITHNHCTPGQIDNEF